MASECMSIDALSVACLGVAVVPTLIAPLIGLIASLIR